MLVKVFIPVIFPLLVNLRKVHSATCNFEFVNDIYSCHLVGQNIFSNAEMQEINGDHVKELSAVDVKHLYQNASTIQLFPSLIIDKFLNLEEVMLPSVGMTSFQTSMTNCANLNLITIDKNEISSIPQGIFQNCVKLSYLSISQNQITEIHDDAFVGLTKLSILRLQENELKSINREMFSQLSSLTTLHLFGNDIEEIDAATLQVLPQLRHLELSQNKISSWKVDILQHNLLLEYLFLDRNQIREITTETFSNLQSLKSLSVGDFLEKLPIFPNLPNLQFISFDDNKLSKVSADSFAILEGLSDLYLRRNQIRIVDFELKQSGTKSPLRILALDGNEIENFKENSLTMLTNLYTFSLNENKLEKLEEKIFRPTFPLVSLNVKNNKIREIDRKLFMGIFNMNFRATGNVCVDEDVRIDRDFDMQRLKDCFNSGAVRKFNTFIIIFSVLFSIYEKF